MQSSEFMLLNRNWIASGRPDMNMNLATYIEWTVRSVVSVRNSVMCTILHSYLPETRLWKQCRRKQFEGLCQQPIVRHMENIRSKYSTPVHWFVALSWIAVFWRSNPFQGRQRNLPKCLSRDGFLNVMFFHSEDICFFFYWTIIVGIFWSGSW